MLVPGLIFYVLVIFGNQCSWTHPTGSDYDTTLVFPGYEDALDTEQYEQDIEAHKFHIWCNMSVTSESAAYFKNMIEVWDPNFARFHIRFNASRNMTYVDEVIQPGHWVWTFYNPEGFFPYLRWPVDFPILSFGLLDSKTLPSSRIHLEIDVYDYNCSYKFGHIDTINSIGRALKVFTHDYLLQINPKAFSYTYFCYLAEIPGVRNTTLYQMGVYFGFPVDAVRYNCCRTENSREHESYLFVDCEGRQITKMFQCTIIPYVIGLVLFAYFPLILLKASAELMNINKDTAKGSYQAIEGNSYDNAEEDLGNDAREFVYLDGASPINFMILAGGLCGLVKKYPYAVSRFRRFIFIILSPALILIKIYVYHKYQYNTTMALLDHGVPMGYLSMIGGFEKSKDNFIPVLGGPYFLLLVFYVAGFVFLVLPKSPNDMLQYGSDRNSDYSNISPLIYNISTVEELSTVNIREKYGYARAASTCEAGICMLTNHRFWQNAINTQYDRIVVLYYLTMLKLKRTCALLLLILLLPLYILLCIIELALCIVFYGIPLLNGMTMVVKGYILSINKMLQINTDTRPATMLALIVNCFLLRVVLVIIITCLFVYYVFSFCTIFTASFSFVGEILVFSLMSVVVYPTFSFGYLFFGIVLLYYLFKQLQSFGDGYFELLADTVEICENMEAEIYQSRVYNGTVVINNIDGSEITRLQVHNNIINLSTDQRNEIRKGTVEHTPTVVHRNQTAGIPRHLFTHLVSIYLPVHIQIAKSIFRIGLISLLIAVTLSIVMAKAGPREGISEVMHVIFIMAIGALPRVLEVTLDNLNHLVKKDIKMRKMKSTIQEYWAGRIEVD